MTRSLQPNRVWILRRKLADVGAKAKGLCRCQTRLLEAQPHVPLPRPAGRQGRCVGRRSAWKGNAEVEQTLASEVLVGNPDWVKWGTKKGRFRGCTQSWSLNNVGTERCGPLVPGFLSVTDARALHSPQVVEFTDAGANLQLNAGQPRRSPKVSGTYVNPSVFSEHLQSSPSNLRTGHGSHAGGSRGLHGNIKGANDHIYPEREGP